MTTPPIRSPYTPPGQRPPDGQTPSDASVQPPPQTAAEAAGSSAIDGRAAGALIGLLLPAALLPSPGAVPQSPMTQSMPVRRQDEAAEEDFSNGAITYPVRMPGPIEVRELEPLAPAYVKADDGSAPAVRLPEHPGPHYLITQPLVDALLEPDLPAANRDALRRDLGVVPAPVLKGLLDAGTRIWIVPEGVTEAPSRVFKADAPAEPADARFEYKGRFYSKATRDDILDLNKRLADHVIDGLWMPSQRVIAIREGTLSDPSGNQGRHRVDLHELGHAVDYLVGLDPQVGETHRQALEKLHAEAVAKGPQSFITGYSRTNSTEHYADGFEAWFTADRVDPTQAGATRPTGENEDEAAVRVRQLDSNHDDLKQQEPALFNLIEKDLQTWSPPAPPKR